MNKDFSNEDIIHIKDKIEYIKFKRLDEYSDRLMHAITLRKGGFSKYPCSSLNFGIKNDNKEDVLKNLNKTCKVLNINSKDVVKARQNHTDNILILDDYNKKEYEYINYNDEEFDGYITSTKNIVSLVLTADCNIVIIYDKKNNVIANIHSGWRGTLKKISLKAVKILVDKFNSKLEDLIICIGPSICKCCFTSEEESFKEKFTAIWKNEKEYICYDNDLKRFHIDLPYLIKKDFMEFGISAENVILSNICTVCNSDYFFSYRKAKNSQMEDTGRMGTFVMLK